MSWLRKSTIGFGLLLLSTVALNSCSMGKGEIHLIPNNYEGAVLIVFNVPDGKPEKYEDGKRVYEIPENGILKTQFEFNSDWVASSDLEYYYDLGNGERKKLPYPDRPENLPTNQIQVFSKSAGDNAKNPENPTIVYLVGKYENAESLAKQKYEKTP